jgi:protein-disulfide isomerase
MNKHSLAPHEPQNNQAGLNQLLKNTSMLWRVVLLAGFLSATAYAQNPNTPVAKVNGQTVTLAEVDAAVANQIYSLQQQLYAIRRTALTSIINKRVLEQEAARTGTPVDVLKSRWLSEPVTIDGAKVEDLYLKNSNAFGLMGADEAKQKLRLDLESQAKLKRYRDELDNLRQHSAIEVLLQEPRLLTSAPSHPGAIRGADGARVVITEFSDFQCPYCKEVQPTLTRVLERYPLEVKLEFKHFPLEGHAFAATAARAAYCSGKQGVFWKFHDLLFSAQDLSPPALLKMFHSLKLNEKSFEECLSSTESQNAIMADLEQGRRLGIDGTPSFIINGKLVRGVTTLDQFSDLISRELSNSQPKTSTSQN